MVDALAILKRSMLSTLEPAKIAESNEERSAIYRLRYNVYIEEMKKDMGLIADHDKKFLTDTLDELDSTFNIYTGSAANPTGTLRLLNYEYDNVPQELRDKLSLDLFPELKGTSFGEIGRLAIDKNARGKTVLGSLAMSIYDIAIGKMGLDFVFHYCAPGLVRLYRKLGYRPYNGKLVIEGNGLRVPMVFVASDKDYLKKVGSPLWPLVDKYYGCKKDGKRKPVNLSLFENRISDNAAYYKVDPDLIWSQLQDDLLEIQSGQGASILKDLSDKDLKTLSEKGFLINVEPHMNIVQQGILEREMFVVLEGIFTVLNKDNRRIATIGEGEPIGELALFNKEGMRTATVKSLTKGRLLVLRQKFLKELMSSHPLIASQILWNISGFMAERLSRTID